MRKREVEARRTETDLDALPSSSSSSTTHQSETNGFDGIIVPQHLIDLRQMALLRELFDE